MSKLYNLYEDYHNFTYPDTPKSKRENFNVGDIYINAVICKLCGWFVRSKNRHDMISCKCGNVSVDGGSWYHKVTCKTQEYESIIIYFNDVKKADFQKTIVSNEGSDKNNRLEFFP